MPIKFFWLLTRWTLLKTNGSTNLLKGRPAKVNCTDQTKKIIIKGKEQQGSQGNECNRENKSMDRLDYQYANAQMNYFIRLNHLY